jgi:TolA-binding protein
MDDRTLADLALAFVAALVGIAVWNGFRLARERLQSAPAATEETLDPTLEEQLGELFARIDAVEGRLNQLALRQQQTELEVMDKAEKVARALADRERKRRRAQEIPDEDHDDAPNDPGELLARARAAFPLPQLPLGMG